MKAARREELRQRRGSSLSMFLSFHQKDMGKRLDATKKLFPGKVLAVDIHSHSNFSDGRATVIDNYEAAQRRCLDFMFATDHTSIGQKRILAKLPMASWGQEPGAGGQHIGLLQPKRKFVPRCDSLAADFKAAGRLAPFVWIPHPVGWYPGTWYSDELVKQLWSLGTEFAFEVINGAVKLVNAFDEFDTKAVKNWDQLLSDGRKIAALGGSDAHLPEQIGVAWTGVFDCRRTADSIIKGLRSGNCFASEAPLLDFTIDGKPMSATVKKRKDSKIKLAWRATDAAGLALVQIVSRGKVVHETLDYGHSLIKGEISLPTTAKATYYRLQVTAVDGRRAFSSPVYVEPA